MCDLVKSLILKKHLNYNRTKALYDKEWLLTPSEFFKKISNLHNLLAAPVLPFNFWGAMNLSSKGCFWESVWKSFNNYRFRVGFTKTE